MNPRGQTAPEHAEKMRLYHAKKRKAAKLLAASVKRAAKRRALRDEQLRHGRPA